MSMSQIQGFKKHLPVELVRIKISPAISKRMMITQLSGRDQHIDSLLIITRAYPYEYA